MAVLTRQLLGSFLPRFIFYVSHSRMVGIHWSVLKNFIWGLESAGSSTCKSRYYCIKVVWMRYSGSRCNKYLNPYHWDTLRPCIGKKYIPIILRVCFNNQINSGTVLFGAQLLEKTINELWSFWDQYLQRIMFNWRPLMLLVYYPSTYLYCYKRHGMQAAANRLPDCKVLPCKVLDDITDYSFSTVNGKNFNRFPPFRIWRVWSWLNWDTQYGFHPQSSDADYRSLERSIQNSVLCRNFCKKAMLKNIRSKLNCEYMCIFCHHWVVKMNTFVFVNSISSFISGMMSTSLRSKSEIPVAKPVKRFPPANGHSTNLDVTKSKSLEWTMLWGLI